MPLNGIALQIYQMLRGSGRGGRDLVEVANFMAELNGFSRFAAFEQFGVFLKKAVYLFIGGGHNTLNVGGEGADFVPFFFNYGINTVILRNRMRVDGYNAKTDSVYDAQQAIKIVRAYAKEWGIDFEKHPRGASPA